MNKIKKVNEFFGGPSDQEKASLGKDLNKIINKILASGYYTKEELKEVVNKYIDNPPTNSNQTKGYGSL